MTEKTLKTPSGTIHYWQHTKDINNITLLFLPGLTADHRLFEKQIDYFKNEYNVFVWDPPAHGKSWPFEFDFDLTDTARWLRDIIEQEKIKLPIIIGQSMGGYVGQVFSQLYPEKLAGFIAIDSAPLSKKYISFIELCLLKRMTAFYMYYPWSALLKSGTKGVAESEYGRKLMREIMMTYDGNQKRYGRIAGHGFKILAKAIEENLPYTIQCPALLICGEKDKAGSCRRYNKAWHKYSGIPLVWLKNAGHNSNTDRPEEVNDLIAKFSEKILKYNLIDN